jgi:hypothetical protein
VQRIIADGESQSAGRLTTYINAHEQADVYRRAWCTAAAIG